MGLYPPPTGLDEPDEGRMGSGTEADDLVLGPTEEAWTTFWGHNSSHQIDRNSQTIKKTIIKIVATKLWEN